MSNSYWIICWILIIVFILIAIASYLGWGLSSDAQAMAQARSVRGGSLHTRHFFGGGPGFGK